LTVTVNVQFEVVTPAVAVQLTVVVPTGKVEPEADVHVTLVVLHGSEADGAG
jgi:hypothetical protein